MSLASLSSLARYNVLNVTAVNPYANYSTTYNINFEAEAGTSQNQLIYMNTSNGNFIPNWTYVGVDGYFNHARSTSNPYVYSVTPKSFMFYGSGNAKSLTSSSMPVNAGNIKIKFLCGASGNNTGGPTVTLSVSINGGAYTSVLVVSNPFFAGVGLNTLLSNASCLRTTPTINIPTTGTITLRFSTGAVAGGSYTMIDDIEIYPV